VVFLLAKELFDRKVALLSSAMYWMLPLELTQSAIVKMQPLANLFTCLAFLALVRFSQRSQNLWLLLAGIFAGVGYYVRPSTLIIPVTVLAFIVIFHGKRICELAKYFGFFLVGYACVVLCMLGYYSRFLTPIVLLTEHTPFGFVRRALRKLLALYAPSVGSMETFSPDVYAIYSHLSYKYLDQAFYFHSFLLVGLAFSMGEFGYRLLTENKSNIKGYIVSRSLLYLWLFFLFMAYGYFFYSRVFFIDYSREFLPPLVIVFAAWIRYAIPALNRDGVLERLIVGGLCLSAVLFFVHGQYEQLFWKGHHASLAIALVTLFTFAQAFRSSARRFAFVSILLGIAAFIVISQQVPYLFPTVSSLVLIGAIYCLTWILLSWEAPHPPLRDYGRFVCLSIILACLVVSVSFSGTLLGLRYDSIWSPQSLDKIASDLKAQTDDHDEVMSGGVIWELQALRRPFQMITHPLNFEESISDQQKATIEQAALARPPKAIILDGYTEKTYFRASLLMELLDKRYQFVSSAGPSVFPEPVKLYRLKERAANDLAVSLERKDPMNGTAQRNAKALAAQAGLASD
jgi:4-amino-4-deoxy-L-arabinose transferase-like glycosyltransferase